MTEQSTATRYLIAIEYFEDSGTYTLALIWVKLLPGFAVNAVVVGFFNVHMVYSKKRLKW